jgi:hypothetical protein
MNTMDDLQVLMKSQEKMFPSSFKKFIKDCMSSCQVWLASGCQERLTGNQNNFFKTEMNCAN